MKTTQYGIGLVAAMTLTTGAMAKADQATYTERRAMHFLGGFETDPRDSGRPVILIASALGVTPEVFREAFSGVHPARDGDPEPAQVERNKQVLLLALGRYGVTNEALDRVSNYYRYMASRGETWRHAPAKGYATIAAGKVRKIVITNPGAGFSSPPSIEVDGIGVIQAKVLLLFSRRFETNGSIRSVDADGLRATISANRPPQVSVQEALRREAIPREVVSRLDLTAEQQRRLVSLADSTNDLRELHEGALRILSAAQREWVESSEDR